MLASVCSLCDREHLFVAYVCVCRCVKDTTLCEHRVFSPSPVYPSRKTNPRKKKRDMKKSNIMAPDIKFCVERCPSSYSSSLPLPSPSPSLPVENLSGNYSGVLIEQTSVSVSACRFLLKFWSSRGSIYYTSCGPLYETAKERHVRFSFLTVRFYPTSPLVVFHPT